MTPRNAGAWEYLSAKVGVVGALGLTMAAGESVWFERLNLDAESLGVLPNPTYAEKLNWNQMWRLVRNDVGKPDANVPYVSRVGVDAVLAAVSDKHLFQELSETLWPFRTKADLPLRRTRLRDWVRIYASNGAKAEAREALLLTREGWDQIFVTNLLAARWVFGVRWWDKVAGLGAFEGDLAHYLACVKKMSDVIKTTGLNDPEWTHFLENAVLSGYRNPPFPGFDVVDEAKALAEGGEEHRYFGYTWDGLCREYLAMGYRRVAYIRFEEFVRRATWLTGGASSVGRLELKLEDGSVIKVKARKNMVADVVDLGELAADSLSATSQDNYVIIKSELGKLRLAVAGDIYTYLKMTWVTHLLGGAYYDWPGNTSEESFQQQTKRMARMLQLCATHFGLPYDYKGFDHQPTTAELKSISAVLCDHARLNVPPAEWARYDAIAANIIGGFDRSTLEVRSEPGRPTFTVTGGLMSGLRWTSIVGNAWNSVVTGLCLRLLGDWGIPRDGIERYIRGDDSAVFTPTWGTGACMNVAYDAVGAQAGQGKFSLQLGQMEFLRVWYSDRCYGYPMRALPGLTQRKPWSSEPWSEDMALRAIYESVKTIRRRLLGDGRALERAWVFIRHQWCSLHRLPDAVCWVAAERGGYGFEPPPDAAEYVLSAPVPRARLSGLTAVNQNTWRADKIRAYGVERYSVQLGADADPIAAEQLLNTVAADNVPEVARHIRDGWLRDVKGSDIAVSRRVVGVVLPPSDVDLNSYDYTQVEILQQRLSAGAPLFGSCPEVEAARSDYKIYGGGVSFRDWLRLHFPRVEVALREFHRSWHRSEALDYLSGHIPFGVDRLHSGLSNVLAAYLACRMQPRRKSVRSVFPWLAKVSEVEVYNSSISRKIYQH